MSNLPEKPVNKGWLITTDTFKAKYSIKEAVKSTNIVKNCQDKPALYAAFSEAINITMSLYNGDQSPELGRVLAVDILGDYDHEPIELLTIAVRNIRTGKRKIYGKVTPADFREEIETLLDKSAQEREAKHYTNKEYGGQEITERKSGRLSDFFKRFEK